METLTAAFAYVCGQARCFVIDGVPLPVCQRCAGLYVGAFVTGVWLLLSRAARRGLPAYGVVCAQALALLVALAGGLHVLDSGPTWRLLCGLWTGHVALLWLVGGGNQLRAAARGGPAGPCVWALPIRARSASEGFPGNAAAHGEPVAGAPGSDNWERRQNVAAWLAIVTMPMLAVLLAALPARGWLIWTAAIMAGAGLLAAAVLAAGVSMLVAGRAWVRHVRAGVYPSGRARLSPGPTGPIMPPPVP